MCRHHTRAGPVPIPGGDIHLLSNFALLLSVRVPVFPHGGAVRTTCSLGEKERMAQCMMAQEIRKTSYRRACNRALRDGTASYRGAEITASQAQSSLGYMHQFHHRVHEYAFDLPEHHRLLAASALSVMSRNAGGLSTQQWHELQEWASTCPYHALCIQETHWTGASQFRANGWHVITSGYDSASGSSTTRSAGVMIALHPSLPDIRWSVGGLILRTSFLRGLLSSLSTAIGTLDIRFEHWATQKQALDHRLSNEVSEVSRGTLMPVLLITPRTQVQAYFALISQ